jgi:hypothetical protein
MQGKLRSQLLAQLRRHVDINVGPTSDQLPTPPRDLWDRAMEALVVDYLSSRRLAYTLSVLAAEAGLEAGSLSAPSEGPAMPGSVLGRGDVVTLLRLQQQPTLMAGLGAALAEPVPAGVQSVMMPAMAPSALASVGASHKQMRAFGPALLRAIALLAERHPSEHASVQTDGSGGVAAVCWVALCPWCGWIC